MPAFNASLYIHESIDSVLAQTFPNWELLVIDDGSTDKTGEIAKNYVSIDNRIQYFYQDNGKQGKARNLGISKSNGDYLAFLDADDLWEPEKLTCQLKEIKTTKVDLVFSNSYKFSDNNSWDKSQNMNTVNSFFYGIEGLEKFLLGNKIPILTVIVKKEKVVSVNGFTQKASIQNVEDYHLWLKLLISGCVFYGSDRTYASYRIHGNSSTATDRLLSHKLVDVLNDLIQKHPNFKNQIQKQLKNKFKLIYKSNLFLRSDLAILLKKNALYLSKSKILFIYLFLNYCLPTKVTKRLLIHILNA